MELLPLPLVDEVVDQLFQLGNGRGGIAHGEGSGFGVQGSGRVDIVASAARKFHGGALAVSAKTQRLEPDESCQEA